MREDLERYRNEYPICEVSMCRERTSDIHHIKTRGSGGPDEDWNLLALCRYHHVEFHQRGRIYFATKYWIQKIADYLETDLETLSRTIQRNERGLLGLHTY